MRKRREFHRINCETKIRGSFIDKWGRRITIMGTHAFEYSIIIENGSNTISQKFNNGSKARKCFMNYKKKK